MYCPEPLLTHTNSALAGTFATVNNVCHAVATNLSINACDDTAGHVAPVAQVAHVAPVAPLGHWLPTHHEIPLGHVAQVAHVAHVAHSNPVAHTAPAGHAGHAHNPILLIVTSAFVPPTNILSILNCPVTVLKVVKSKSCPTAVRLMYLPTSVYTNVHQITNISYVLE